MPVPVLMRFVVRMLANLTDPAAKGFEDRVIRVLEIAGARHVQPGLPAAVRTRRQLRGFRNKS